MEKNKLILTKINKEGNKLSYMYSVEGPWKKAFSEKNPFFIEYQEDMQWCPDSIAVIPFLGNFLPIAWVYDAEITIGEIDEDFLHCIDEVKQGYCEMYPKLSFKGSLRVKQAIRNKVTRGMNKSLLFFSGGVDATSSLVSTLEENPTLVTLWGSDIFFQDTEGWQSVTQSVTDVATRFSLPFHFVKTSFRKVVNYTTLNEEIAKPNHENWWHGFQHGLAIITHAAPLAYLQGIRNVYIASTDSVKGNEVYTCASHPTIDNNVKFCGCKVLHEGFENSRSDKVRKICAYSKRTHTPFFLRVCWVTRTGKNCCLCEKCMRTMYAIYAEGFDPAEFGFDTSEQMRNQQLALFQQKKITIYPVFWADTIQKLSKNTELMQKNAVVDYLVKTYLPTIKGKFVETPPTPISFEHRASLVASPTENGTDRKNTISKSPLNLQTAETALHLIKTHLSSLKGKAIEHQPAIVTSDRGTSLSQPHSGADGRSVMFKSPLNLQSVEAAFKSVGMNTGNQVFAKSLDSILDIDVMPWSQVERNPDLIRDIKNVVTTDLIWINQDANFDYLYQRLEKIQKPFVPISIGLQAANLNSRFKINSSTLKVLQAMQERATLGVRGEYTASVLEKHGIRNIQVIGCPSLYWFNDEGFQLQKAPTISNNDKVLCNFRTFYGNLSVPEKHFLTYCANRKYTFVEQTSMPFAPELVHDTAYYNYINKWLSQNTVIHFDTESWRKGMEGFQFSFGGRFHGNIIALWNQIPALFLTLDSRTKEMTDFFHLPSINMSDFDDKKPIQYYYDLADYTEFNRLYREKFCNFKAFVEKNNLSFR